MVHAQLHQTPPCSAAGDETRTKIPFLLLLPSSPLFAQAPTLKRILTGLQHAVGFGGPYYVFQDGHWN